MSNKHNYTQRTARLVWGFGNKKVKMGDDVRYKIGQIEYSGKVIAFQINEINPQKYAPIARDLDEMTTRCIVDIVPIDDIIGTHNILNLKKPSKQKTAKRKTPAVF